MKTIALSCILVFSVVLCSSAVIAEGFYVIPVKGQVTSWDKKISGATRFKLVLDDEAVLDKETGLVWEQAPATGTSDWGASCFACYRRTVGGRYGWRPPTVEELASLFDPSLLNLPSGHPFTNVSSGSFWSSTTNRNYGGANGFMLGGGVFGGEPKNNTNSRIWCVRGGWGHDAY